MIHPIRFRIWIGIKMKSRIRIPDADPQHCFKSNLFHVTQLQELSNSSRRGVFGRIGILARYRTGVVSTFRFDRHINCTGAQVLFIDIGFLILVYLNALF